MFAPSPLWKRLVRLGAAASALASLFASLPALAAGITIGPDVTDESGRDDSENNFWISYSDCKKDHALTFQIQPDVDPGGNPGEIWASTTSGADCSLSEVRSDSSKGCVKISDFPPSANATPVTIKATEITTALGIVDCIDTGGDTDGRPLTIYFLIIDSSNPCPFATWDKTTVDLLGPVPPTSLSLKPGEESLVVDFTAPSNTSDLLGYYVYAESLEGSGGAGGGGGSGGVGGGGSGGVGGGGGSSGECAGSELVEGEAPPGDSSFKKGDAGNTATQVTADELVNDVSYAVAVAGHDTVGNLGKLSEVVCGTPMPVDDYFKLYRTAGGQAGGGFCAVGFSDRSWYMGCVVALGLVGLALRRRARVPARGGR